MAITVKHKFVSAIPDGADATVVRPSNWNDDHDLTGIAENGANTDITSLSGITGGISSPDYIAFDTTYATALTAGQLGWNGNNTLALGMYGGNVVQHIGEDSYFYIKASSAITKGQVVMFTGAVGASGVLTGAPSTGVTNPQYIMGIAAETIVLNDFGLIQLFGELTNLNTNAFNEGDVLYYDSAVTGGLTNVFPTSGIIVQVAAVAKKSVGGGVLVIRVSATQRLTASTGISVSQTSTGTVITNTSPSSGGTVTSVAATVPALFSISGSPITSSGTLAMTYSGTALPAANGGTGQTSYAVGDIVYASTTTALSKLADVATGSALISGGVGVAPSYGKIGLTTHVSGTLPIANGGTNATTASITSFNNITGYSASGATGTTSTNLVFSTAPTVTNPTLTGFIETVFAATGTTPALSPTNGTIQTWTLSGSSTPTAGTWTAGASLSLQITAGANTITWSSMPVTWMGGTAPTLSTTVTTNIELWKIGTTIYGALVGLA